MISQRLEYAREAAEAVVDGGLSDINSSDIDAMTLADLEDFLRGHGVTVILIPVMALATAMRGVARTVACGGAGIRPTSPRANP
jgi:hypothetical protein